MSRHKRRVWPWLVLLIAASAGGWWWWDQNQKSKVTPVEYETSKASIGEIIKSVRASGDVNPLSKVEIGSQISGTISKLYVDFNSKVKAGDLLCQLDSATYDAAYAQANAEKISAEADRDYQKLTTNRKRSLLQEKLFSQADFDKSEADLKSSEAKLLLADARLKKAKVDLDRCAIVAPIDGVITDRTAEIGQTIAASFNAPKLFILANDLTKMQINAKVSEAFIGQVVAGQKVEFNVDAYTEDFFGEVVQVRNSPITEENVVNYDAVIAVNNKELKLKPGMTAVVKIVTAERKDALRIPNAALRFKPEVPVDRSAPSATKHDRDHSSEKPEGGKKAPKDPNKHTLYLPAVPPATAPTPVEVTIGITDGVHTEILSGLKEGDAVITMVKPPVGGPPASNPLGGGGMGRR